MKPRTPLPTDLPNQLNQVASRSESPAKSTRTPLPTELPNKPSQIAATKIFVKGKRGRRREQSTTEGWVFASLNSQEIKAAKNMAVGKFRIITNEKIPRLCPETHSAWLGSICGIPSPIKRKQVLNSVIDHWAELYWIERRYLKETASLSFGKDTLHLEIIGVFDPTNFEHVEYHALKRKLEKLDAKKWEQEEVVCECLEDTIP